MKNPNSNLVFPGDWYGFDSRDCLLIYDAEPGDTTVQPCPPELLPLLMAEREKIARWQNLLDKPEFIKNSDTERSSS